QTFVPTPGGARFWSGGLMEKLAFHSCISPRRQAPASRRTRPAFHIKAGIHSISGPMGTCHAEVARLRPKIKDRSRHASFVPYACCPVRHCLAVRRFCCLVPIVQG